MSLVIGIDSSTQSCKIEIHDPDSGALVHSASASHPPTVPPRSEQAPDAWWHAMSSLLDGHADDVGAISVAGQQHGMVVLDEQRTVLRPAKLWNDTESAPQAQRLVDELGAGYWAEHTGSVPVASFTITKLAWLREHEPEVFAHVRHVVLPHDWLTYRLTGELVTDRGDASGTGYWSPATGEYWDEVLERVGLDPSVAPTVLGPATAAGTWGEVVVGPGTGDNMAAALGLGLVEGDVAISLGTSGTVFAVSDHPTADVTGAVAGFADATGRYLPLVCTLNATKVTDTVARLLGMSTAGLDRAALDSAPGAGGVVMVPYLDGERTPNLPDATGRRWWVCGPTRSRHSSPAPRTKGWSAACSKRSTRSTGPGWRLARVASSWSEEARGPRRISASSPTSPNVRCSSRPRASTWPRAHASRPPPSPSRAPSVRS